MTDHGLTSVGISSASNGVLSMFIVILHPPSLLQVEAPNDVYTITSYVPGGRAGTLHRILVFELKASNNSENL